MFSKAPGVDRKSYETAHLVVMAVLAIAISSCAPKKDSSPEDESATIWVFDEGSEAVNLAENKPETKLGPVPPAEVVVLPPTPDEQLSELLTSYKTFFDHEFCGVLGQTDENFSNNAYQTLGQLEGALSTLSAAMSNLPATPSIQDRNSIKKLLPQTARSLAEQREIVDCLDLALDTEKSFYESALKLQQGLIAQIEQIKTDQANEARLQAETAVAQAAVIDEIILPIEHGAMTDLSPTQMMNMLSSAPSDNNYNGYAVLGGSVQSALNNKGQFVDAFLDNLRAGSQFSIKTNSGKILLMTVASRVSDGSGNTNFVMDVQSSPEAKKKEFKVSYSSAG